MTEKKIIAVVGATGAQGGSLVRAIMNDKSGEFKARATTRNASSEKAQDLIHLGIEVVVADADDKASLVNAFDGAYGVFCVTNFWEHFSTDKEISQATNMAKAAKETGVKHVIWSTLEDTRKLIPLSDERMPTLQGKYKVPHFDAKGEANAAFESNVPYTLLHTSFYWDNFIYFGMGPQKGEDGNLAITFPMGDKKLPGIAAEDIGKCAFGVFKGGEKFIGKSIGISGEQLTGNQMAEAFTDALGKQVAYNSVPAEVYRSFGFQGADDLGNMFQYKHDFESEFCEARNVDFSKSLNSELLSFNEWLSKYKELIPNVN
ncbi:MAG: NmrA/HSCARG family protein [Mariniphaga sp.]|nr:NmrA/HSCARG family protein [Mariniphaga sp.]